MGKKQIHLIVYTVCSWPENSEENDDPHVDFSIPPTNDCVGSDLGKSFTVITTVHPSTLSSFSPSGHFPSQLCFFSFLRRNNNEGDGHAFNFMEKRRLLRKMGTPGSSSECHDLTRERETLKG